MAYPTYTNLAIDKIEADILEYWQEDKTFQKSLEWRKDAPKFVFYEGPPGVNGAPGIHHTISRVIKDLCCRYKTQSGFLVNRRAGWDAHGLPVELSVEKRLNIVKDDVGKKISIEEYNQVCRQSVSDFKEQWDKLSERIGYWLDLHKPYLTCANEYIESLWWVLSELYKRGYLYKSWSIQPYSPAAGTGLSTHELNQPGAYKLIKDITLTAMFELNENNDSALWKSLSEIRAQHAAKNKITKFLPIYLLAWTTTPWTLPSNLALALGEKIDYALYSLVHPYTKELVLVVLAKSRIQFYAQDFQELLSFHGSQAENLRYVQLLDSEKPTDGDPFRVILGDFVSTEDGTGIVHIAPAFGADDYKVGQKYGIGMLNLIDERGRFREGAGIWAGQYVKNYTDDPDYQDPNLAIALSLKQRGQAFKIEKYEHNYPHCWRTGKPIIYYPMQAWFIRVSDVSNKLIQLNEQILWKPTHTGQGRFGKWLENLQDWNLSRSRFWGTPLPIWRTKSGNAEKIIDSIATLKKEIQRAKDYNSPEIVARENWDLHRPFLDEVVLVSDAGEPMYREPDLIDVWFDSGAMPYAQWHYPFENLDVFQQNFPADLVCEGVDQTRGWFYTLHVLAALLFDSVAFKAVISNGLVLDKNGEKMSKRLNNTIEPFSVLSEYGADPLRWYLITNASPWDNLRFDLLGINEVKRKFFGTLFNTYQFFALYANLDGFDYAKVKKIQESQRPLLDQWLLSELEVLLSSWQEAMENYETTQAYRLVEDFVLNQLSNWYVRLGRKRFWKQDLENDKISAYQTLYECLNKLSIICAPAVPFFAEFLFQALNKTNKLALSSVHCQDFPKHNPTLIQSDMNRQMHLAKQLCSVVHSIRKAKMLKVRQPLAKILLLTDDKLHADIRAVSQFILQETNVKELDFAEANGNLIRKKLLPNYALLGKKLGKKIKILSSVLAQLDDSHIVKLEELGFIELELEGELVRLNLDELIIKIDGLDGWEVESRKGWVLALDLNLTKELRAEALARELVNRIQKLRKDKGLDLSDKIKLTLNVDEEFRDILTVHKLDICNEVLAESFVFVKEKLENADNLQIEQHSLSLQISKT